MRTEYEYKSEMIGSPQIHVNWDPSEIINRAAKDGWRLIQIIPSGSLCYAFFERQKRYQPPTSQQQEDDTKH